MARLDPRIHFALVCAARSCPPIAVYEPEHIDAQLDTAAAAFIHGGAVRIDRERGQIRLSKIFQCYAPDFGGRVLALGNKRPLLEFITRYVHDPLDRAALMDDQVPVRFQPYEWALNAKMR